MSKDQQTDRQPLPVKIKVLACLFFGGAVTLHLWSLLRYPAVFTDEGWLANRAWNFKETGRAFGTADAGVLDRFNGYWTYFQWLPSFFRSLGLRFDQTPNIFSARLVSFIFGLVLLYVMYEIGKQLIDPKTGLLSAGILVLSAAFLYSAHLSRDDIFAATFGYLALALYLRNRDSQRILTGFLCGLSLGLAFEIHPHSAIFTPAVSVLFLFDFGKNFYKQRGFWGFLTGGVAGGLFYAERHIFHYPATYFALSELFFMATHTPPLMTFNLSVIRQAFLETGLFVFNQFQVLTPVIIWAIAVSVIQVVQRIKGRHLPSSEAISEKLLASSNKLSTEIAGSRTLLIFNGVLWLGFTLLIRNKFNHYAILVTPATDLLLAVFLFHFFQKPWRGKVQDYANRVSWGLLIVSVFLTWSVVKVNSILPYQQVTQQLRSVVKPGDVVMGPETYWFGLSDHVFPDWLELVIYERYQPGSDLEKAFYELHPDVFIVDSHMEIFISDHAGDNPFLQHFSLPKTELESFLKDYAELVLTSRDPGWVPVWVYRIDWNKVEQGKYHLASNRK